MAQISVAVMTLFLILEIHGQLEIDKRNWVDPGDMLNYHGAGHPKTAKGVGNFNQVLEKLQKDLKACEKAFKENNNVCSSLEKPRLCDCEELLKNLTECESKKNTVTNYSVSELIYMRRFVSHLVRLLKAEGTGYGEYELYISLTTKDLEKLNRFIEQTNQKARVEDVDAVLTNMIHSAEPTGSNKRPSQFWSLITKPEVWIGCALIVLVVLLKLGAFSCFITHPVLTSIFLVIPLSCFWNYYRMYMEAHASRHAELNKFSNIPPECNPQSMTWWMSVKAVLSGKDKCYEYHRHILVDPIWEVSPAEAIMETISVLLVQPMGHVGTGIGKFFYNLIHELPLFWGLPILLILFITFLVFLLLMCGYSIKIPFLLAIEPPRHRNHRIEESPGPHRGYNVIHHVLSAESSGNLLQGLLPPMPVQPSAPVPALEGHPRAMVEQVPAPEPPVAPARQTTQRVPVEEEEPSPFPVSPTQRLTKQKMTLSQPSAATVDEDTDNESFIQIDEETVTSGSEGSLHARDGEEELKEKVDNELNRLYETCSWPESMESEGQGSGRQSKREELNTQVGSGGDV